MEGYWTWYKAEFPKRQWGIARWRVATICRSAARRDNLTTHTKQADDAQRGSYLYLLVSETDFSLTAPDKLLSYMAYTC